MKREPLVSPSQAARLVNRPYGTVQMWYRKGQLDAVEFVRGPRRYRPMFAADDVLVVAARMDANPLSKRNRNPPRRQPTAEELDRCIEEQMKCLPKWWDADVEYMRTHTLNVGRIVRLALAQAKRRKMERTKR